MSGTYGYISTTPLSAKNNQFTVMRKEDEAKTFLTLFFQFVDISHNCSKERSLVRIIVHALLHQVSQLLAGRCWKCEMPFKKPLLLQDGMGRTALFPGLKSSMLILQDMPEQSTLEAASPQISTSVVQYILVPLVSIIYLLPMAFQGLRQESLHTLLGNAGDWTWDLLHTKPIIYDPFSIYRKLHFFQNHPPPIL